MTITVKNILSTISYNILVGTLAVLCSVKTWEQRPCKLIMPNLITAKGMVN